MYRYSMLLFCLLLSACGASGAAVPALPATATTPPASPAAEEAPSTAAPTASPQPAASAVPADISTSGSRATATTVPAVQPSATTPAGNAPTATSAAAGQGAAPSPVGSATSEIPTKTLAKLKADLAKRAGVNESAIVLISAQAVTWNNSALGCPQPDVAYMQVIIEGYQAILQANGVDYDYRVGRNDQFIVCSK